MQYLETAEIALSKGADAPAYFNAAHALELAVKAALATVPEGVQRTHNVGGAFGKHFKEKVGADVCRQVNRILAHYDQVRYPGESPPDAEETQSVVAFVRRFVRDLAALL